MEYADIMKVELVVQELREKLVKHNYPNGVELCDEFLCRLHRVGKNWPDAAEIAELASCEEW